MRSRFRYIRLTRLDDVLEFLDRNGESSRIMAGGTDLMIAVRAGSVVTDYVVDISRLEDGGTIEMEGNLLRIGAAATFSDVANSPIVREKAPLLARAAQCVGSPQIRNMGTIGGNIANASPAADSIPPLLVHNARAEVRSLTKTKITPVEELIIDAYKNALMPGEVITGFLLEPMDNEYRTSWQRIARRRALAVARINVAAMGRVDANGKVCDARLAVGSITPVPKRMDRAERTLLGRSPGVRIIKQASATVSEEMIRISGVRPTTDYKRPALEGAVFKALSEVFLPEDVNE